MLRKLIRKEYYDKDFPLNEQEFKGIFLFQLFSNRLFLENSVLLLCNGPEYLWWQIDTFTKNWRLHVSERIN